tara:strand:- start:187 stop:684 length:498 start_codon:yes stop_codon:yes gene_type:complete
MFSCEEMLEIPGCTYENALNYYEYATTEDGSCVFQEIPKLIDIEGKTYHLEDDKDEGGILYGILQLVIVTFILLFSIVAGFYCLLLPFIALETLMEKIQKIFDYKSNIIHSLINFISGATLIIMIYPIIIFIMISILNIPFLYDFFNISPKGRMWFVTVISWFIE